MSERRYSEEEVARIFERATEAQKSTLPSSRSSDSDGDTDGLTLAELQEVGREVGLPADLVARAAKSLDRGGRVESRKLLGFVPVGVGRTFELERPLTDPEWHRLVTDLRETFDARGKLSDQGPFKQWTNGNLQALLEPTPDGQRLRLKTVKGSSLSLMGTGAMMLGITSVIFVMSRLSGGTFDADGFATLMLVGLGLLAAGVIQLPAWARKRSEQMEAILERVSATISASPTSSTDES